MSATYTTVFCDDVREEKSGKHILVGVYGADLVPSVIPSVFPISVWVRILEMPTGSHSFKFALKSPSGDENSIEGDFTYPSDGPTKGAVMAFAGLPVNLRSTGQIVAFLSFDDAPPEEVGILQVLPPLEAVPQ